VARHLAALGAAARGLRHAHTGNAVEAFELNALDYLLKPVRAQRLAAALRKAAAAAAPGREQLARAAIAAREYLSIVERHRILLVPVRDIVFLRAEQKYVTVRTRSREHLIEEPLVTLEEEFARQFVRIHRNCLVARAAIRGFERAAEGRPTSRTGWWCSTASSSACGSAPPVAGAARARREKPLKRLAIAPAAAASPVGRPGT